MNQHRDVRQESDNPEQWRAERERIQSEVSADVDALRSDASHLVGDVRRGARRVGRMVQERWRHEQPNSTSIATTARENPIPTAMIGVGLGWLLWRTIQERGEHQQHEFQQHEGHHHQGDGLEGHKRQLQGRAQELREDAKHGLKQARETASSTVKDFQGRARSQVQTARERSSSLYEDNPFAFAGAATLAGVGIGMMLPVSRREQEAYGPLRERLVSQAKGAVVQRVEQAENTAKAASQAVKQGLGAGGNGPREADQH